MLHTIILIVIAASFLFLLAFWFFAERWRLLRPSTWKAIKENGLRRIFNLSGLHGYIYGRWTNQYIKALIHYIMPRSKQKSTKWLTDRYHGKVITQELARAIITLNKKIPLQDLEQIIPYPMARNLVLEGPPDVVAYECPCRHARTSPCQPTQVCMIIGQPFADFIFEHNPKSSRRLSQAEALELLRAEHERGHMHSAWFKDAAIDRFYVICNCCKCCCGGIEAMIKYGVPTLAPSGYAAQVDKDICTSCGTCANACPFGALSMIDDKLTMEWEKCMGCGVCTDLCPSGAMALVRDERKGIPMDVRLLSP